MQQRIYDLLPVGKEHAISMKNLAKEVGTTERNLRKLILQERKSELLILSSSSGYFLPGSEEEIDDFIRVTKKAAMSKLTALKAARKYKRELRGQQFLNLPEHERGMNHA